VRSATLQGEKSIHAGEGAKAWGYREQPEEERWVTEQPQWLKKAAQVR